MSSLVTRVRAARRLPRRRALAALTLGLSLCAAPAAASTVSMEEIERPDGSKVGKLSINADRSFAEVNRIEVVFGAGNHVRVTDSAGINAEGGCNHQGPARTVVVCDGKDGVAFDAPDIDLGGGDDRLVVNPTGGAAPSMSIESGAGNDVVVAGSGDDSLYDEGGADTLAGGAGNDGVFGQDGDDRLFGGPGNDRLEGGFGNDRLFGGLGDDFLVGGPGNDLLYTGPGSDRAIGGGGHDRADGRRLL